MGLRGSNKKLTPEKQRKIYEAHQLGKTITDAATYAGVDKMTIHKYWSEAGLISHGHLEGGGRPRTSPDRCPQGYVSASEASRQLGVTRYGVSYLFDKNRLKGYRENGHFWISEGSIEEQKEFRGLI